MALTANNDVHVALAKGGVACEVKPAVFLAGLLPLSVANGLAFLHGL